VDDTDDEYYARLFQEEEEEEDDDEFVVFVDKNQKEPSQEQEETQVQQQRQLLLRGAEWNRGLEQLQRERVEYRQRCRNQVKRSRRLAKARQLALQTLGWNKLPRENVEMKRRYQLAKGVYARLLETLNQRHEAAQQRAKLFVVNREAQLAAHFASHCETQQQRVGQLTYLKTIQSVREKEANQTRILTELALCETNPPDKLLQGLSNDDLMAVLRIRGNVKGRRRLKKRETILDLLDKSFQKSLY
jgi:hypothetical protein